MNQQKSINIRPDVSVLSTFRHLKYTPYHALAEFVDNAIDSYLKNERELRDVQGTDYQLTVKIEFNNTDKRIVIKDNAAGIHTRDFPRAFKPAAIPPDTSKLSEFGMGMKSAAFWFTKNWEVRTSALGESIENTISFDLLDIIKNKTENIQSLEKSVSNQVHYTVVTLKDVGKKIPVKKGLGKVKRHLKSIYRDYIRKGTLRLLINGTEQTYETPKILCAPYYNEPNSEPITWKREVDFDFGADAQGNSLKVKGFVALMATMSIKNNGFALFRRGRVIEGSADDHEGFKPTAILGPVGSHRYKRLFGELHLEGFNVTHTKDGFQWDDNLEDFLDLLKEELNHENEIPILKQGDKYRVKESDQDYEKIAKTSIDNTIRPIKKDLPKELNQLRNQPIVPETTTSTLQPIKKSYYREFSCELDDSVWNVHIEESYDDAVQDLIEVGDHLIPSEKKSKKHCRDVGIRLSLKHPFMIEFAGSEPKIIKPILRIVVALGLAEVKAKGGRLHVNQVRHYMNELLKGSLSKS